MAKIEVSSIFFDMIHYKDKVKTVFAAWDEKYGDDERGALVAGIKEAPDSELINLLINIQHLADGYEKIQELMTEAEQREVEEAMKEDDDDDEEEIDF